MKAILKQTLVWITQKGFLKLSIRNIIIYWNKTPKSYLLNASETYLSSTQSRTGTYTAMEPRQYRASGMSVSEGRNGGDAKAYPVELAKQQNGRANKISSRDSRDTNLFLPCVLA